jgi:hypothetical protein
MKAAHCEHDCGRQVILASRSCSCVCGAWLAWSRRFLTVVIGCVLLCALPATAEKPEPHKKTEEDTVVEHSPDDEFEEDKPATVFSFGRFEKGFKSLCAELEDDQRRMKVFLLAQARAKDPNECPSCRALWRSISGTCRQVKKDPAKAPTKAKKKKKPESEEHAESHADGGGEAATPAPAPTAIPAARMPSTSALDDASLLSNAFYEADPKRGGIYQAVLNFKTILLAQPGLTPAEKDYYGILTTYLLCAWEGRESGPAPGSPEATGGRGAKSKRELQQMFE